MGKCVRSTKGAIKRAAKMIGRDLLAEAGRVVQTIEDISASDPDWWRGKKRGMAEAAVKASADRLKRDVPNHLIELAVLHAVTLLKDPDETVQPTDLGDATDEEIEAA